MARVSIVTRSRLTARISSRAEASANMNARVSASVSRGSCCMPAVVVASSALTRSAAVSPVGGCARDAVSATSRSRTRADTSRCTLEGK